MLGAGVRLKSCRTVGARAFYSCGVAALVLLFGSRVLQNAIAEGDTRTISLHHAHTNEDITITFKRDGRYDEAALEKLNWFLRDWRRNEQIRMDPHLIDLVWEVQRETGSKQPIWVVCGYRSPETNAMLRRRSDGVARLQPAHARPRHGLLYSGRTARTASGHWFASGARRRGLLPDLRLAVCSYGHRRCAALAAHDTRAAGPRVPGWPHGPYSERWPSRCPDTRWRWPICASAATIRRRSRSRPRAAPVSRSPMPASPAAIISPFKKLFGSGA